MNNDRVILVKGNNSNWYEQAIFIVKPNVSKKNVPVDLVSEAEKIINSYVNCGSNKKLDIKPQTKPIAKRSTKTFDFFLNVVLLVGVSVLAGIIAYNAFL